MTNVRRLQNTVAGLHFERRADGRISREDLTTALPPDDLVVRAARALQTFASTPFGAHIGIAKSIPAQAGMGGGSSDAASCLLALNRLWQLNLPLATLMQLGLQLVEGCHLAISRGGPNQRLNLTLRVVDEFGAVNVIPRHDAFER